MGIKGRIVALDIGTKRIGVAVCDPMWIVVSKVGLVERKNSPKGDQMALDEIKKICDEYNTKTILIGVPYNMDGTLGFQAQNCIDFIKPLEGEYKILYHDERLTSFEAEEMLKKEGKKYTKNKGMVDVLSACIILQDYINEKG